MTIKNLEDLLNKDLARDLFLEYQKECGLNDNFQIENIQRHLVLSPKTYALLYEIKVDGTIRKLRVNASGEETRQGAFQVMKFLANEFSGPQFFIPKVYFYDSDYNLVAYENVEGEILIDQLNNLYLVKKISLAAQWLNQFHRVEKLNIDLPGHETFFNFEALKKFYPKLVDSGAGIIADLKKRISSDFEPKLIHGDYQPNNIIVDKDSITVFDFNDSRFDDPALDLAKFLSQLKVMLFRFADVKDFDNLKDAFLTNYHLNFNQNNFQIYSKMYYLQILCSLSASLAEDSEAQKTIPEIYKYWEEENK
ncbi:MAG TPA: aminoglycoside phosphotransferase family protein [Patescibacteria group bacterium]|nr:aminoglycoside phosphotransferase family protein [Patescibacteria group bacterium]